VYMINMAGIYACSSVDSALLDYGHSDGDFRETAGNHGDGSQSSRSKRYRVVRLLVKNETV